MQKISLLLLFLLRKNNNKHACAKHKIITLWVIMQGQSPWSSASLFKSSIWKACMLLKSKILNAHDCFLKGNHSFPKGNNQGLCLKFYVVKPKKGYVQKPTHNLVWFSEGKQSRALPKVLRSKTKVVLCTTFVGFWNNSWFLKEHKSLLFSIPST